MVGRNPKPGAFYPATASVGSADIPSSSNNESLDMNNWDGVEFRKFMKWFIEVHHPEAIGEYQAVRAIERKIEEEERNRIRAAQLEADMQLNDLVMRNFKKHLTEQTSESVWDAMKRMAGYKK